MKDFGLVECSVAAERLSLILDALAEIVLAAEDRNCRVVIM